MILLERFENITSQDEKHKDTSYIIITSLRPCSQCFGKIVFSKIDFCAYIEEDAAFQNTQFFQTKYGDMVPSLKLDSFWIDKTTVTRADPGRILTEKEISELAPNQGRATEFIGILNIERFNKRIL
jgi:tRNA(Arg) A34 adenosine deaminase TadA